MLHGRMNKVSSFLDEVKQYGSPTSLDGLINELEKLFEEKDRGTQLKKFESDNLSPVIQNLSSDPKKRGSKN